MKHILPETESDIIRNHVRESYLKPAVRRGERVFTVNAGAIHRSLGLRNRVPLVCAALRSRKFLDENGLRLISKTGPPSGQSTTVTFTYEVSDPRQQPSSLASLLHGVRGIAQNVFGELGGGESFIRKERESFNREG